MPQFLEGTIIECVEKYNKVSTICKQWVNFSEEILKQRTPRLGSPLCITHY